MSYKVTKIYRDGDAYLRDILNAIDKARHSIYVESYIFELPEPGLPLLSALELKQKQGLEVKVLVDGLGSYSDLPSLQEWSENSWVPLRIYNPIPWQRRWRFLFFPFYVLLLIRYSRFINRRDHRKMVVIDGQTAFLGSINFARVHFSTLSFKPWFDLAVQIEGDQTKILERAFLHAFNRSRIGQMEFWSDVRSIFPSRSKWFPLEQKIRVNHNFLLRFLYWRDLLRRIRKSKNRVYIMNAYFVPHRTLLRSLIVAARAGVDVKILLPSESDVPVIKWFAPMFYRRLISKGVGILEMQKQMLHSKSVIIDDWALVGSNNLNYRSLLHDLEVDAVVEEPGLLNELLSIWKLKSSESTEIKLEDVVRLNWLEWIRLRIILLIRYYV